jgi:hypothetical protein
MRTALIDGDEIAYKVALRYQQTWWCTYLGSKLLYRFKDKTEAIESIGNNQELELVQETEALPPNGIEDMLDTYISSVLLATTSTDIRLYLSGSNNFRYPFATLTPYKGNRAKENKPIYLEKVKSMLVEMGAESLAFLEADDMMSSGLTLFDNAVICSTDKDLRTVPSLNFNMSTRLLQVIKPETARFNFFKQLLIGDTTDAIPSPFNLGEVGADKFLKSLPPNSKEIDYYQAIYPFYQSWLVKKDKEGNFKTKWFNNQDIHDILFEIGNLLWMRRTRNEDERWNIPLEFKNG